MTFDNIVPKIKRSSSVSAIFSTVSGNKDGVDYHSNEVKLEELEYAGHKNNHKIEVRNIMIHANIVFESEF